MKDGHKAIMIGGLAYLVSAASDLVAYMQGVREAGGTLESLEPIAIVTIALSSLSAALGALLIYLTDAPEDKRLLGKKKTTTTTTASSNDAEVET